MVELVSPTAHRPPPGYRCLQRIVDLRQIWSRYGRVSSLCRAGVAKLADAPALGAGVRKERVGFESHRPHSSTHGWSRWSLPVRWSRPAVLDSSRSDAISARSSLMCAAVARRGGCVVDRHRSAPIHDAIVAVIEPTRLIPPIINSAAMTSSGSGDRVHVAVADGGDGGDRPPDRVSEVGDVGVGLAALGLQYGQRTRHRRAGRRQRSCRG